MSKIVTIPVNSKSLELVMILCLDIGESLVQVVCNKFHPAYSLDGLRANGLRINVSWPGDQVDGVVSDENLPKLEALTWVYKIRKYENS